MTIADIYNFFTKRILPVAAILLISAFLYTNLSTATFFENNINSPEEEIISSSGAREIISTRGRLTIMGWTKNPSAIFFTPDYIRPTTSVIKEINSFRLKRWERYVFTSNYITFSIMIYDYMYAGGYNIYYSDTRDEDTAIKRYSSTSMLDKPSIAENCYDKCYSVKYPVGENQSLSKSEFYKFNKNSHKVKFNFKDKGLDLELELTASAPRENSDSIVNISSISNDSSLFYITTNTNLMTPKGKFQINKKAMQSQQFHITYNSGIGVFPIRVKWLWITANGFTTDKTNIGLNFGFGLENPTVSQSTENAFNINGNIFKLKSTNIELPTNFDTSFIDETSVIKISNKNNLNDGNECEITFKPLKKLIDNQNLFYMIMFTTNISHGVFSGTCKNNLGKIFEFSNINGTVEFRNNIF